MRDVQIYIDAHILFADGTHNFDENNNKILMDIKIRISYLSCWHYLPVAGQSSVFRNAQLYQS